ncbi:hypothetical protein QZN10_39675 [Burkholderia contaminans]|jgi:hypothetical protein|uniref:hypothetical protein n=1 Tax=Burkholderia contaminans TaxID=488447 RepID=UPI000AB98D4C|nr:hypothetical protein [Burkholderia contaminans]MDN8026742.1 hypothetical protein [Burkholderia contaminans]
MFDTFKKIENLHFEHVKCQKDTVTWTAEGKSISFNARKKAFYVYPEDSLNFEIYKGDRAMSMIDEVLDYFELHMDESACVSYIHKFYYKEKMK